MVGHLERDVRHSRTGRHTRRAAALPHSLQMSIPYASNAIMYLVVVAGLLTLSELTVGKIRFFAQIMALPGLALGLTGIGWFVATGSAYTFLPYNNLLVACALLVLTIVVIVPKLSSRFLVFPNRVLTAGTLLFAIEALYANVSTLLNLPSLPTIASDLGFAVFLFSLAYVAAQRVFAGERRLLSIESELEVARQIQSAILPASIPEVKNLSIAASYQPMTAVAGDFYEFIQTDQHHVGVLVADVSGHGVPAALLASMIKMAVQSVLPCAHDPREVLRKLNHILFGHWGPVRDRGLFVGRYGNSKGFILGRRTSTAIVLAGR